MTERLDTARLRRAGQALQPAQWDADRAQRVWAGVPRKRRRQRATRAALLVAALVLLGFGGARFLESRVAHHADTSAAVVASAERSHALVLADGSRLLMDPGAEVTVSDEVGRGAHVVLTRGGAVVEVGMVEVGMVEVGSQPSFPLSVSVGPVLVTVAEARLRLVRDEDGVTVEVFSGIARVVHAGGQQQMVEGQSQRFSMQATAETQQPEPNPTAVAVAQPSLPNAISNTPPDAIPDSPVPPAPSTPTNLSLAGLAKALVPAGEAFVEAFVRVEPRLVAVVPSAPKAKTPPKQTTPPRVSTQTASPRVSAPTPIPALTPTPAPLPTPPPTPPPPSPEALSQAADARRAEGRPAEALALLAQLMETHPTSSYFGTAALTSARLLTQQRRPCDAAALLARTQETHPLDPLSEDFLVREVEALTQCGQTVLAQQRARHYLTLHPNGAHTPRILAVLPPLPPKAP